MLPSPLLVLTDRRQAARLGLVSTVAAAVAGGARAVLLREKDLGRAEREDLGRALVELLAPVGGTLLVAGPDHVLARRIGADGLHLASADPVPPERTGLVLGRSCHDGPDLASATAAGCDYATISPVFASPSKPGYGPPLGAAGLAELTSVTALPVVALGGITPANAASCLSAGAAGVAVMGAVMAAHDPAAAASALLATLPPSVLRPGARPFRPSPGISTGGSPGPSG